MFKCFVYLEYLVLCKLFRLIVKYLIQRHNNNKKKEKYLITPPLMVYPQKNFISASDEKIIGPENVP